jgi:hypothetical protein
MKRPPSLKKRLGGRRPPSISALLIIKENLTLLKVIRNGISFATFSSFDLNVELKNEY